MSLARTQYATVIAKVGGYYNFVTIVNRRMKELRNNAPPMVEPIAKEDEIDLIVREIEAGFIDLHVTIP